MVKLKQEHLRLLDQKSRKTYVLKVHSTVKPYEATLLAYLFSRMSTTGGHDWWEFVETNKLKIHFEEEKV